MVAFMAIVCKHQKIGQISMWNLIIRNKMHQSGTLRLKKMTLLSFFFLQISFNVFGQQTILWSVKDTGNHKTTYLLGTYHQIGNSFVDSIPDIEVKLNSSELAIFESVDNENLIIDIINARKENKKTMKFISNDDFFQLKELSKSWKVDINKLSTAEIVLKLQQSLPVIICGTVKETDKFSHFDNYLIYKANQKNIPVYGLESDTIQIQIINQKFDSKYNKKEKEHILYLSKILAEKDKSKYSCEFVEKYKKFDLHYELSKECNDDILLKQRNDKWLPIIVEKAKKYNCFIAVGFLHLYNNCGLITQLRNNGFVVEPVSLK